MDHKSLACVVGRASLSPSRSSLRSTWNVQSEVNVMMKVKMGSEERWMLVAGVGWTLGLVWIICAIAQH